MTRFQIGSDEKDRAIRIFRSRPATYHQLAGRGVLKYLRGRERATVLELAHLREAAGTMLDVGCGTGVYALAGKAAGLRVTAMDVSPWAVQRVRDRVDAAFVADVETLHAATAFAIVVCSGVLDYAVHPEVAVHVGHDELLCS